MTGLIPRDVQQLAGPLDRLASQKHIDDKPFHKNGETPVRFSLGNLDLNDTMLLATDPANTGMDQCLKLAEIQMPPSSSGGMIVATVFPFTLRAVKPTLRIMIEGDMDGLTFHLNPHIHHFPRRG
jgi:hypothetical protein